MTKVHYAQQTDEPGMTSLARLIAPSIRPGMQIHLQGDLGAGKTTLVRALLQALGHRGRVKSPTYGLIEPYDLALGHACHLDLYRISDPEELEYLGLRDLLEQQTLLMIEWPERGGAMLPPADLQVLLAPQDEVRRVELVGCSAAGHAIVDIVATIPVLA